MRPINLIPEQERRSHGSAARTGPLAYIAVGSLVVLLLGVVMLVLASNEISDREGEVETLETQKAAATAEATALAPYVNFQQVAAQRTQTVAALADGRFDWERVIRQLSLVLPPEVFVTDLTASAAGGEGEESGGGVAAPSLTIAGCAPSQDAVAGFVTALKQIDGVTRVGLSNSSLAAQGKPGGEGGETCPGADFNLTIAFDGAPVSIAALAGAEAPPAEAATEAEGAGEPEAGGGSPSAETPSTSSAGATG